jgi:hypothetical protein
MNNHQHDQDPTDDDLRAGLARLATYARTHHDPASDALRRARHIRSRRRATTVAAGIASIAVALPVGLNLLASPADHTRVDPATATPTPAQTPGRTPTSTPSSTTTTPTVGASPAPTAGPVVALYAPTSLWSDKDFDGLPPGEDPKVPWYADGKIHYGATTTPVDLPDWTSFEPVDGGYLVTGTENGQWRLQLVGLDGTQKLTARGSAVVSNDGRQIAWATPDGTVNVADARTGKILHSIHVGKGGLGGFLGEQVLLTIGSNTPESSEVQAWDPRTGKLTAWRDFADVQSTYGADLAAVVPRFAQGPVIDREDCSAVIDTDNGNRELWRVCPKQYGSASIRGFSPDGRYAVVWIMNEGQTLPNYTIADAQTGRPVLTIMGYSGTMEWEDEELFLLASYSLQGERRIVRCTVAGTCELATEGRPRTAARTSSRATTRRHAAVHPIGPWDPARVGRGLPYACLG